VAFILDFIKGNKGLQELSLRFTESTFGQNGAQAMKEALNEFKLIRKLSLMLKGCTKFRDDCPRLLADALATFPSLISLKLELYRLKLNEKALRYLKNKIVCQRYLENLELQFEIIGVFDIHLFTNSVRYMKKLYSLDIYENCLEMILRMSANFRSLRLFPKIYF